jgi:hypothetical protein
MYPNLVTWISVMQDAPFQDFSILRTQLFCGSYDFFYVAETKSLDRVSFYLKARRRIWQQCWKDFQKINSSCRHSRLSSDKALHLFFGGCRLSSEVVGAGGPGGVVPQLGHAYLVPDYFQLTFYPSISQSFCLLILCSLYTDSFVKCGNGWCVGMYIR